MGESVLGQQGWLRSVLTEKQPENPPSKNTSVIIIPNTELTLTCKGTDGFLFSNKHVMVTKNIKIHHSDKEPDSLLNREIGDLFHFVYCSYPGDQIFPEGIDYLCSAPHSLPTRVYLASSLCFSSPQQPL